MPTLRGWALSGAGLALLNPLRDNPEREDFGFGHGFRGGCAVGQDAGKLRDFRQPTAVLFSLAVEVEFHLRAFSFHKNDPTPHAPAEPPNGL